MVDKAYEAARNKLIPQAEEHANSVAGPRPKGNDALKEKWAATWNRAFHSMMNILAKQAGLVRG